MADFGGNVRFTYGGSPLTIRAKVEIEPTDFNYTAEHNQNGSFDRYMSPQGPMFDCEFVDSVDGVSATSLPWNTIMAGGPYNIAIIEDTTGVTHTLTGGKFIGRPKVDRLKGLVTGVTVVAPTGSYQQIAA